MSKLFSKENGEVFNITVYSDGDQIVHKYKSQFDIILMDVEMKFMDGMSAAEEIRKVDTEVVIIFITNMAQYAIRGYAVDALDYVLKPVSYFDTFVKEWYEQGGEELTEQIRRSNPGE